ncbi:hypothetical protein OSB04_029290, partial [Centaurea solstitialis]
MQAFLLKLTFTSNNLFVCVVAMAQPSPSTPVVVLGPKFLVPYEFNILVHASSSSSSFSDGNLVITDVNREILLKVEPQNTTIHHQRVLVDLQDRFIVTLREKMQPWDAVSFMVKIQPNVDYAFVVALIAIIDAMKSTERKDKIVDNAMKAGQVLTAIVIGPAGF